MNNYKNDKKLVKLPNLKNTETSPNLSIDSNEDLLFAIKQVAKEMAEAVKKTEKEIEKSRLETERKENETQQALFVKQVQTPKQTEKYDEQMSIPIKQTLNEIPPKNKTPVAVSSSPPSNLVCEELPPEHLNNDADADPLPEDDQLHEDNDIYPQYEDFNIDNYDNGTDFVKKSFYERNVESYNKIQQKLELQRNKKLTDEMRYMQTKPQLTQATKKIIQNKLSDHEPIYNRINQEIFKKNQKLEFLKFSLADTERLKESHNVSRYNTGHVDKEQIDNFVKSQIDWKKKRDDKISEIKNEIEKFEDQASRYLFQPAILKSSEVIAQNKIKKNKDKQVHKRLYNLHEENLKKKKINEIKSLPSFKPSINRNYPSYMKRVENGKDLEENQTSGDLEVEQCVGNKQEENSGEKFRNKNTVSVPKTRGNYSGSSKLEEYKVRDDPLYNLHKMNNQIYHTLNSSLPRNNKINYEEEEYNTDDTLAQNLIKAYKTSLDEVHNNPGNHKVLTMQGNQIKNSLEYNTRHVVPKPTLSINSNTIEEGLDNLYKINLQEKGDNKVLATPQFATMIKKNFNKITSDKIKYSK